MCNLDNLPFDVLFEVGKYLALEDVVALGCTSRQLRAALRGEEALARMIVMKNATFSREALLASSKSPFPFSQAPQDSTTNFRRALLNIQARRSAYATASPRSACVVDSGVSDFLNSEGVLCYVYSQPQQGDANAVKIRVLNLEDGGRQVAVLNADAVVRRVVESVCGEEEEEDDDDGDGGGGGDGMVRKGGNGFVVACWNSTGRIGEMRENDATRECGMAHRAAVNLGFEGPLWGNLDVGSTSLRSRSGSPFLPGGWSTFSSSSSTCSSAPGRSSYMSRRDGKTSYPTPRVTLVHYSTTILSLYVNFSASLASASKSLRSYPHYLVAIRLPTHTTANCTTATSTTLRIFRLPNRAGGYGSDNAVDHDFRRSNNNGSSATMSAACESDGAGRGLKLFVRNTASHYYFGTHTGRGREGERVWVVQGVELRMPEQELALGDQQTKMAQGRRCGNDIRGKSGNNERKGKMTRVVLPQISSTALGVDTCFFIHGNWFHGITSSNHVTASFLPTSPTPVDDSTAPNHRQHDPQISTYTSLRFPLASPDPDAVEVNARVFRRHHGLEGPMNDAWTALEAVVDECDGEVRVMEERREWTPMRRRCSGGGERSWYFGELGFGGEGEGQGEGEERDGHANLENRDPRQDSGVAVFNLRAPAHSDPLPSAYHSHDPWDASPLDAFLPDLDLDLDADPCSDSINDSERPWQRHPQHVHRESFHDNAARSFTLSRTKHRAYNYSAAAFLDLVEDERCCAGSGGGPCLRMRIGARRQRVRREDGAGKCEMQRQEDEYVHGRVRMWPQVSSNSAADECQCAEKLHAIMNAPLLGQSASSFAPAPAIDIFAVTNERSMVFLRRPKYGGATARIGPLVLVSFDYGIAAQGSEGQSWKRRRCCS